MPRPDVFGGLVLPRGCSESDRRALAPRQRGQNEEHVHSEDCQPGQRMAKAWERV